MNHFKKSIVNLELDPYKPSSASGVAISVSGLSHGINGFSNGVSGLANTVHGFAQGTWDKVGGHKTKNISDDWEVIGKCKYPFY